MALNDADRTMEVVWDRYSTACDKSVSEAQRFADRQLALAELQHRATPETFKAFVEQLGDDLAQQPVVAALTERSKAKLEEGQRLAVRYKQAGDAVDVREQQAIDALRRTLGVGFVAFVEALATAPRPVLLDMAQAMPARGTMKLTDSESPAAVKARPFDYAAAFRGELGDAEDWRPQ